MKGFINSLTIKKGRIIAIDFSDPADAEVLFNELRYRMVPNQIPEPRDTAQILSEHRLASSPET